MTEWDKKFLTILQMAFDQKASDIHFSSGEVPAFRTESGLIPTELSAFSDEDMSALCNQLIKKPELKSKISVLTDLKGSFSFPNIGQYRFSIFRNKNHLSVVFRTLAYRVPTIKELSLPNELKKLSEAKSNWLMLVVGKPSSGKSTTLAAMVDHVNRHEAVHILTLEEPIEYIFQGLVARVTQREIGRDTDSFSHAIDSLTHQNPDLIVIGEIKNLETLEAALKAVEMGYPVFSTLNIASPNNALDYLVSLYPAAEQISAHKRISTHLHTLVSQKLISSADGKVKNAHIEIIHLKSEDIVSSTADLLQMPEFPTKHTQKNAVPPSIPKPPKVA